MGVCDINLIITIIIPFNHIRSIVKIIEVYGFRASTCNINALNISVCVAVNKIIHCKDSNSKIYRSSRGIKSNVKVIVIESFSANIESVTISRSICLLCLLPLLYPLESALCMEVSLCCNAQQVHCMCG